LFWDFNSPGIYGSSENEDNCSVLRFIRKSWQCDPSLGKVLVPLPLPDSHAGEGSQDIFCLAISGYLLVNTEVLRNLSSLFSIPESG